MTYKQIEASREVRLWLGQIIAPAIAAVFIASPEARDYVKDKAVNVKNRIKNKFSK